jgi:hypothetical protein
VEDTRFFCQLSEQSILGIEISVFNLMYLPMLLFLPRLIYPGELKGLILTLLILGGQVALFLFDTAYRYFQGVIWGKSEASCSFENQQ